MKRSNMNMAKPTVDRLYSKLTRYKCNTDSKLQFTNKCRRCGTEYTFFVKDLKDKVLKCPNCRYEEIYFDCNFM